MTKPIKVHICPPGPNPWKVIFVLEELGVPYEINSITFPDLKQKPFLDLNPNGRNPVIEDPNNDLVLWETGAIIQYLVEQYDTEKKFTYTDLKRRHHVDQYLAFQVSGQGPYFGQAAWFNVLHPEKIPSAIERYTNETKRVLGVLETVLEGKEWLVGDKITYADLSFVPWNDRLDMVIMCAPDAKFEGFPNVKSWHERMISRSAWKRCIEKRDHLMDLQGLMPNGMPKGVNNMAEYEAKIKADTEGETSIRGST